MFYFFVWCTETSFLSVLWQILSQILIYLHSHLKYIYLKSKKTSVRKKKKKPQKNPEGRTETKLQSHSFPSTSCDSTFLSCGTPVPHLTCTVRPPCVYSGWKRNLPLTGAQGRWRGPSLVVGWWHRPRPGSALGFAQTSAALPSTASPSPSTDGAAGAGRATLSISLGHRKASAAPPWAPSPAIEGLELSGRSEAHQRISDKLGRTWKKKELQWEINLSAVFYGCNTLSLTQQEFVEVEGDGKALISTKAVCSVVLISLISLKVVPRGQNLFRSALGQVRSRELFETGWKRRGCDLGIWGHFLEKHHSLGEQESNSETDVCISGVAVMPLLDIRSTCQSRIWGAWKLGQKILSPNKPKLCHCASCKQPMDKIKGRLRFLPLTFCLLPVPLHHFSV